MSVGNDRPVKLRLIGDVHGQYKRYLELIRVVPFSVQVGDFGFEYECLRDVDPAAHKIIPGNHDNYERLPPHALHPFGVCKLGEFTFFFIRGAHSIDRMYRAPGINWWPAEELTTAQGDACVKAFTEAKPGVVLSHDCPFAVYPAVLDNPWFVKENWTARFLEECRQQHQPRRWIFGHHHRTRWTDKIGATRFHCLGELEVMDFYDVPPDAHNNGNNNTT
jgi:hypothetical protein